MNSRPILIACETVLDAVRANLPKAFEVSSLPMSLHADPQLLRHRLQEGIDAADGAHDPIILGFGLCSQATVGLRARHSRLVIPRRHDCIGMLLGSNDDHRSLMRRQPGTYFLTRGWSGTGRGTPFEEYEQVRERWGEARAKRLLKTMLKHYRRLVYITSPGEGESSSSHAWAHSVAHRFGLQFERIDGKPTLIKQLIHGPWDDDFLLVPPGQEVKLNHFLGGDCGVGRTQPGAR